MKKIKFSIVFVASMMFFSTLIGKQEKENIITVTTLIENTCISERNDLISEHGVSMHIEFGNKSILFDVGSSDNFIKNASKLNINISDVDILVISHAHRDHGGGLDHFLKENSKARIYMHENTKKEYYYSDHHIGLDNKLLSEFENRITFIKEYAEIIPNVFLLTSFSNKYLRPRNSNLYMKDENGKNPDNLEHEIVFVLKREDGLVVLSGCSHNGILNMTDAAFKRFPNSPVKAVLGGFHLMNPGTGKMAESEETVANIANIFQTLPVEKIYTGHCTGNEAFRILENILKHKLAPFKTGSIFQL